MKISNIKKCNGRKHVYTILLLFITIFLVQRGIVGNIVSRFEQKGYKLCAMKTKQATSELLEQHYKDLVEKPFFPKLKEYMLRYV